jgi:hypothetical protein
MYINGGLLKNKPPLIVNKILIGLVFFTVCRYAQGYPNLILTGNISLTIAHKRLNS